MKEIELLILKIIGMRYMKKIIYALFLSFVFTNSCISTGTSIKNDNKNDKSQDTTIILYLPNELNNIVFIAGGNFVAGENSKYIQGKSALEFQTTVGDFLVEKKEVSNGEYKYFIDLILKQNQEDYNQARLIIDTIIANRNGYNDDIPFFIRKIQLLIDISQNQAKKFGTDILPNLKEANLLKFNKEDVDNIKRVLDTLRICSKSDSTILSNDLSIKRKDYHYTLLKDYEKILQILLLYIDYDPSCWPSHYDERQNYYFSKYTYNYPVVGIPWIGAKIYASYYNKRLPTEIEFEYLLKNGKYNGASEYFTWISDVKKKMANVSVSWDSVMNNEYLKQKIKEMQVDIGFVGNFKYANYTQSIGVFDKDGFPTTAPVDTFSQGIYNLYNMAGNVSEYTEDDYLYNAYLLKKESISTLSAITINTKKRTHANLKVIRGGSWGDNLYKLRSDFRDAAYGNEPKNFIGFRCAMDMGDYKNEIDKFIDRLETTGSELRNYIKAINDTRNKRVNVTISIPNGIKASKELTKYINNKINSLDEILKSTQIIILDEKKK